MEYNKNRVDLSTRAMQDTVSYHAHHEQTSNNNTSISDALFKHGECPAACIKKSTIVFHEPVSPKGSCNWSIESLAAQDKSGIHNKCNPLTETPILVEAPPYKGETTNEDDTAIVLFLHFIQEVHSKQASGIGKKHKSKKQKGISKRKDKSKNKCGTCGKQGCSDKKFFKTLGKCKACVDKTDKTRKCKTCNKELSISLFEYTLSQICNPCHDDKMLM
jgi:hypothetical protein